MTAPPSGKRVLVVGAGPSGLSAAYQLRLLGHEVTIRDSAPAPGGMMRYGIPSYRLPRQTLSAEIDRILGMGVTLESGQPVTDIEAAMADGQFDAAFLAVGAQKGKRAYIPAGDSARILDAVTLLHSMEGNEQPQLGRRVAIYGGGNTAMDAARTARRLGATDAVIVYRRTRAQMPAHDVEVEEAAEEGVRMMWLSTIARAESGKLTIEKMKLDETGFPQPTGEFTELDADAVVLALGQEAELALLDGVPGISVSDGVVQIGADLMTGHPGIFAGGDMVPAERTATVAIGHGKTAARSIDAWLRGARDLADRPAPRLAEAPAEPLVLLRCPSDRTAAAGPGPADQHVRRGDRRPGRVHRHVRGSALPVLRQLLRVRQLLRCLPGQRGDQARTGPAVPDRPGLLQGLRDLRCRVPVRRHRHGPGADLTSPVPLDH